MLTNHYYILIILSLICLQTLWKITKWNLINVHIYWIRPTGYLLDTPFYFHHLHFQPTVLSFAYTFTHISCTTMPIIHQMSCNFLLHSTVLTHPNLCFRPSLSLFLIPWLPSIMFLSLSEKLSTFVQVMLGSSLFSPIRLNTLFAWYHWAPLAYMRGALLDSLPRSPCVYPLSITLP